MEIKNLKKAAERIKKAVAKKESIILYGDSDLDGTASVIILKETIQSLGGRVLTVYFPDREKEGYGITETALDYLKKEAPALLISMDLGIGNFKEVLLAKKMGFEVLIIDHHEILGKIPKADIVIDPKQKGDKYSFKGLAAVGIVYLLAEQILAEKLKGNLKKSLLELAALGTVADMMPKKEDNKLIIEEGLPSLSSSFRPGIKIFWENEYFEKGLDLYQKVFKVISLLNVRDVKDRLPASFRLFSTPSSEEAAVIVKKLQIKHKIRRKKIDKTIKVVEKRMAGKEEGVIFEGDEDFDSISNSSAASILCRDYSKPVFIFKRMQEDSLGTVRSVSWINAVSLMKKCSKILITYGGHPQAAGFRVKNKNLDKFKNCLLNNLGDQNK
ncbi:MAG: DHH family phosphoesterase [Candidatus Nealsonbacteria bacterium]